MVAIKVFEMQAYVFNVECMSDLLCVDWGFCFICLFFSPFVFLSLCLSVLLFICLSVLVHLCTWEVVLVLLESFCAFLADGEQKVDGLDVMVIIGQWSFKSTFGANNCKYLLDNKWLFVTTSENRWNIYKYYHHFCDAGYCGAQY